MAQYLALKRLTNSASGEVVEVGETIDLAHLDDEQIAALVAAGAVEAATSSRRRTTKPIEENE